MRKRSVREQCLLRAASMRSRTLLAVRCSLAACNGWRKTVSEVFRVRTSISLNGDAAIKALFEKGDHEGLKRMYHNFAKVGGQKVLHAAFKAYVQVSIPTP